MRILGEAGARAGWGWVECETNQYAHIIRIWVCFVGGMDGRLAAIDPKLRPLYPPAERLAILELKARRGWSNAQTARVFHLAAKTIASWLKRLD
ncbi:MAG: helix-turn-helix domain-containing protein, partial [Planctomycetota bacterium]